MNVVHCQKQKYDVYIGRANSYSGLPESKWHNPFVIGVDGTRKEVIAMYKEYVQLMPELMSSLHELEGKTLGCWCHPSACHGDVLVELCKINKPNKLLDF
jgi:hypothetical protein